MYKTKIFYKSMLTIFLLSLGYFVSINLFAIPKITHVLLDLEKQNAKLVLNEIVTTSNAVYKDIDYFPKIAINIQKENLKNFNNIAFEIVQKNYEKYKNHELTLAQAKQRTYKEVGDFRYGESGYFFILSAEYTVLAHLNKKLIGKNYSQVKDIEGNYFVKEMVDAAKKDGEGYKEYLWENKEGKLTQKMSHIKKFAPWDIYIGTGVFIDNITSMIEARKKELYNNLYAKIAHINIANSGSIYILNSQGKMLYHPDLKLQGKDVSKIKNPGRETYLFDDLVSAYKSGDKELTYLWNKVDDKQNYIYKKISWIEYVKDLDWYIVSSVYEEEFQKRVSSLTDFLLLIGLILLSVAIAIASVVFKQLDRDISAKTQALVNAKKKLKNLANIDLLTKLYNRRYLYYIVPKLLSLAKREKTPLSILMMDLDKFKDINDTYGHAVGDKVLELFADVLRKHSRQSDVIARIGGEEFLIILNNTSKEQAYEVAQKIRKYTKEQVLELEDGARVSFSISIGVDSVDVENERNIEKSYIRADKALYKAKENGRDRVEYS